MSPSLAGAVRHLVGIGVEEVGLKLLLEVAVPTYSGLWLEEEKRERERDE